MTAWSATICIWTAHLQVQMPSSHCLSRDLSVWAIRFAHINVSSRAPDAMRLSTDQKMDAKMDTVGHFVQSVVPSTMPLEVPVNRVRLLHAVYLLCEFYVSWCWRWLLALFSGDCGEAHTRSLCRKLLSRSCSNVRHQSFYKCVAWLNQGTNNLTGWLDVVHGWHRFVSCPEWGWQRFEKNQVRASEVLN